MVGGPYVRRSRGRDAEENFANEDFSNSRENSWAAGPGRDPASLASMKNVYAWPLSLSSTAHDTEQTDKHTSRSPVAKTFGG